MFGCYLLQFSVFLQNCIFIMHVPSIQTFISIYFTHLDYIESLRCVCLDCKKKCQEIYLFIRKPKFFLKMSKDVYFHNDVYFSIMQRLIIG